MNGRRAAEGDGFDLSAWLEVDPGAGATADVTVPATAGDGTDTRRRDSTHEGFAFAEWIADGEGELQLSDPTGVDGRVPGGSIDDPSAVTYAVPPAYRPAVHPTLAATLALFFAAATLAVLTVGGVLPPLGPATGLPA